MRVYLKHTDDLGSCITKRLGQTQRNHWQKGQHWSSLHNLQAVHDYFFSYKYFPTCLTLGRGCMSPVNFMCHLKYQEGTQGIQRRNVTIAEMGQGMGMVVRTSVQVLRPLLEHGGCPCSGPKSQSVSISVCGCTSLHGIKRISDLSHRNSSFNADLVSG